MPHTFFVVHLGTRTVHPLRIVLFRDRTGERSSLAARNSAFCKPLGNAVLDHLANRAKLFTDSLRFPHQRFQHDIRLALLVTKISAYNLLRRLELAINAPIALLQTGGVPRQVKMYEVGAIGLEVNSLP